VQTGCSMLQRLEGADVDSELLAGLEILCGPKSKLLKY
jgi:hypothetical protein